MKTIAISRWETLTKVFSDTEESLKKSGIVFVVYFVTEKNNTGIVSKSRIITGFRKRFFEEESIHLIRWSVRIPGCDF
jgi:hypothetical protein